MKKRKKKKKKILFVIEILILLILAAGLYVFVKLGSIDHVSLKDIITNEGAVAQSGYRNLVIYGVDSREGNLTVDSHSDTIIICSINQKTKEVKMVSVYRDTYLDNTNGEYRKATECYYFGGPERSINMLNKNLDLDIKDYVAVNFNAVVEAVDLIGGIDLDVTDEELQWLNGYLVETSAVTGVSYTPLESSGYQHLDGIQTMAYCRIRYTDGYDFKRTERQRTVLNKIFEKAKAQGVPTLLSMVNSILPSISTSLSTTELISLVSGIGGYTLGENTGFPFDQTPDNNSAGDCVVPVNLAQNVTQLHAFLFGTEGYTPSAAVQQISNEIINNTGIQ
ncbi:MAG: LCP family protein [Lachnospiraceae bacterium]|nr:LCP family protein [Lachnospiraceae bacterium]MDD3795362.1 LCP family protein [Lachnospiraceae bacterium]